MLEIELWKIFTSLGVPGVALGVFYMLFRTFKWEFPKVPRGWVGPIIITFMVLTSGIILYALTLFAPQANSDSSLLSDDATNAIQFPVNDRILERYLLSLEQAVESHNWQVVLTLFGEENFQMQRSIGIRAPQYIEEGLSLGFVNNDLITRPNDRSEYASLNAIETIHFTGMDNLNTFDENESNIYGSVTLFDGTTRPLHLFLIKTLTGRYELRPPVG